MNKEALRAGMFGSVLFGFLYAASIYTKLLDLKGLQDRQDANDNPTEQQKQAVREIIFKNMTSEEKAFTKKPENIEVSRKPNLELDSLIKVREQPNYLFNPFRW